MYISMCLDMRLEMYRRGGGGGECVRAHVRAARMRCMHALHSACMQRVEQTYACTQNPMYTEPETEIETGTSDRTCN